MYFKQTKFKKHLSKAISAMMVFWLSSVLILVCCQGMTSVEAAELIPDCHKNLQHAPQNDDSNKFAETNQNNVDCCIFKLQKTLSTDLQISKDLKHIQVAEKPILLEKPVYVITQDYQPAKVYHSAIRNRGSTYLLNCNFRI